MLTLRSITQERAAMTDPRLGYDYPAGAEEDSFAPWNEGFSDSCLLYTSDAADE